MDQGVEEGAGRRRGNLTTTPPSPPTVVHPLSPLNPHLKLISRPALSKQPHMESVWWGGEGVYGRGLELRA